MDANPTLLNRTVQTLFLLFLIFAGLYFTKEFLMPIALAGVLAMLFLPFSRWMERKGINRTVTAVVCVVTLVTIVVGFVYLVSWRVSNLDANLRVMEQQANQYIDQLQAIINKTFGLSPDQQKELVKKQGASGAGNAASFIAGLAGTVMGSLTTAILVMIYIFLFISSRRHFKNFILKLVANDQKSNTTLIIEKTSEVAQNYVSGLVKMIVCLWLMYGIGFSIIGVQNAIFFAILCGTLEIIPFVGNITGTALTVLMALAQGGGGTMVVSVLITYGLVQFIQSYVIQPLVVGKDVDINPFFSITVLVLGELLWGVGGMVLSIPLLGMVKIVCDHIEPLQPYGFLIGNEQDENTSKSSLADKMKRTFKRKGS